MQGKGKIAAIILSKMKEKASPPRDEPASDSYDGNPGKESAMEDFCKALKAEDYAGMADALRSFIDMHEGEEDEGE